MFGLFPHLNCQWGCAAHESWALTANCRVTHQMWGCWHSWHVPSSKHPSFFVPGQNRSGHWRNCRANSEGLGAGDECLGRGWEQQRLRMWSWGCRGTTGTHSGTRCHSVPWQPREEDFPLLQKIAFGLGDEPGQGVIHARRPSLIILTRQNDIKDLY